VGNTLMHMPFYRDISKLSSRDTLEFFYSFIKDRLNTLHMHYGKGDLDAIVFETSDSGYILATCTSCAPQRYRFTVKYNGIRSRCAVTVRLHGHCSSF